MQEIRKRIVYIDLIKVFLTCMVVAHHAGQAYGNTGGVWLVSDAPKLDYLKSFFFINASYMMGFYFFISGYFTYYSLHNKSVKIYLKSRFFRLGLPLLFFAFFIFGPLHYFSGNYQTNFFSFLIDLHFNHPPLSLGHLWFVASLLAYSLVYLLIVKIIKVNVKFADTFKAWYPIHYLVFLIPANVLVRHTFPIDYWVTWLIPIEVAHLPQYLSLFLLGALFNKAKWLETIKPLSSFAYMFVGLLLFFSRYFIYQQFTAIWSESVIESFLCVGLCFGIFSFFKLTFNHMNSLVRFLSDNSYGIYLFHLLIVAGFQLLLLNVDLNTNLKFVIVTLLSIFTAGALSAILRKNSLMKRIL